ncbi:MAG TPA: hypothetical protein VND65_21205 [Candidatus Binatia bacterium]|nr:hypothetical protein [Candidatus Binatia bacterium]
MRIRRTLPIVLAVIIVAAAVTLAVQLRKHAPPEAARLLPGADAFFYVDLTWARKAKPNFGLPPISRDPEYQRFINEAGFDFERDLDEAAFALHYPGDKSSPDDLRSSEIVVGKFDLSKVTAYLKHHAKVIDNYESIDIYSIPIANRTFRVAILSPDSVAASNVDDATVIRGMVDRSRRLASPFGGPALLRKYYRRVQLSSPVWIVAHVDPSSSPFAGSVDFLSHPADVIVSASFNPLLMGFHPASAHLRAEAVTASEDDARTIADKVNSFLALTHAAENSAGTADADGDIKALLDSLKIRQDGDHAVLTAAIPLGLLHKAVSGSTPGLAGAPDSNPNPR